VLDPHIPSEVAAHPGTATLAVKRQHAAGHATAAGSTGAYQPAAQGAMLRHHALNPRPTNKTPAGQLDSRTAGMQQYSATAEIPKIIHQNYMSGPQQLLADALKPLSHFRKEWWMSCKVRGCALVGSCSCRMNGCWAGLDLEGRLGCSAENRGAQTVWANNPCKLQ